MIDIFGAWCNNYFDGIMTTNIANNMAALNHKVTVFCYNKNFNTKHKNVKLIRGMPTGGDILIIQYEDVIKFLKTYSLDDFKKKYKKVYYHATQCSGWHNNKSHHFLATDLLSKLDNMICALKWDAEKATKQGYNAKFGGRGACSEILNADYKYKIPIIFLDYERGSKACRHKDFREALKIVKEKNPNIRIGTFTRSYPISNFVIKWGSFAKMANSIYNPSWIFLPSHNGGYELPIIEAQMAGCTICSFKNHVQEEILSDVSKQYVSNSIDEMADNILKAIDNFKNDKNINRQFALINHRWSLIAQNWIDIIK